MRATKSYENIDAFKKIPKHNDVIQKLHQIVKISNEEDANIEKLQQQLKTVGKKRRSLKI